MALVENMDKRRAEEEFLKVLEIEQAHVEAHLMLVQIYLERGEMQKAAERIREILKIDPTNEEARKILERMQQN
jgi:Tfp pilus assembly protein PilF